ncbi:hypothetical protein [Vreelandella populi]|nr:hypothetical protein [Halomonas populi]
MAMGLMLCMFVLFLGFSAIGLYMMFKSSFMVTTEDPDDIPPEL